MPGIVSVMIGSPRLEDVRPWMSNIQLRPLHPGSSIGSVVCDCFVCGELFKVQPVRGICGAFSSFVIPPSSKWEKRLKVAAIFSRFLSVIGSYSEGFPDVAPSEMRGHPSSCDSHSSYLAFKVLRV